MAATSHPDRPTEPYSADDLRDDFPRDVRRGLYERLLSHVDHRTSPSQLPWARQVVVKRLACANLPCRPTAIEQLLDDLVERKQLLRWRDADDYLVLCRTEPQALARAHSYLGTRDRDRPRLRAWLLEELEARRG